MNGVRKKGQKYDRIKYMCSFGYISDIFGDIDFSKYYSRC